MGVVMEHDMSRSHATILRRQDECRTEGPTAARFDNACETEREPI